MKKIEDWMSKPGGTLAAIALLVATAQLIAALTLRSSLFLSVLGDLFPCMLLCLAIISFGKNYVSGSGVIRRFWLLTEAGIFILLLSQGYWIYFDVIIKKSASSPVVGDGLFIIAPVFLLAALALRPNAETAAGDSLFRRLDFLILLSWWVCLYFYFALPWLFAPINLHNYNVSYNALTFLEHLMVIAALAALRSNASDAWRKFYGQYLLAFCLLAVGNFIQSVAFDQKVYYTGSLYDIPFGLSLAWLTVAGAAGANLTKELPAEKKPASTHEMWMARLAMLAVISLPLLTLAAFLDRNTPPGISLFRLRMTLSAILVLGSLVFLKLTLMDNELLWLVGMTEESLLKLKQVQNQIVQSQKMAALVRFTAGAAHEISNPLTAILGYAELLRDNPSLTAEERLATKTMQLQVHRAQAAIDSMRVVARTVSSSGGPNSTPELIGAPVVASAPEPSAATVDSEDPIS